MSFTARRVTITINPSEMVTNETISKEVRQISGIVTVDSWDKGLTVIDRPSETLSMSFYLQPGIFGMSAIDEKPMPILTEEEREYIRSIAEGYSKGKDDKGGEIFIWSMNVDIVYQIVGRYSEKPLKYEDGCLAIYKTIEDAHDALFNVGSENYKIRVSHVAGSRA